MSFSFTNTIKNNWLAFRLITGYLNPGEEKDI